MVFWIVAALLTGGVLLALLTPLYRTRTQTETEKAGLAVYQDQLAEIDRDVARGLIAPELAESARAETARRLLAASKQIDAAEASARPAPKGPAMRLALALALVLPAAAGGVYLSLGRPELPAQPLAARQAGDQTTAGAPRDVLEAVAELARRLDQSPDDPAGWRLLAQSYQRLGRFDQAVDAWRRAVSVTDGALWATGGLSEALVLAGDGRIPPESVRGFNSILAEQPNDPRANFYIAEAEAQAGQFEAALKRWQELVANSPADAPWLPQVRIGIVAMAEQLNLDVADVMPTPQPAASGPEAETGKGAGAGASAGAGAVGPSAEDMQAAAGMSPEQRRGMIEGMVEGLASRLEADPSDIDGWLRLARSYDVLGRSDDATAALAKAVEQAGDRPDVLLMYARRLLGDQASDPGSATPLSDAAVAAYRKLLTAAPDHPEALWFLGLNAANRGDAEEARRHWTMLLAALKENPDAAATVRKRLEQLPE